LLDYRLRFGDRRLLRQHHDRGGYRFDEHGSLPRADQRERVGRIGVDIVPVAADRLIDVLDDAVALASVLVSAAALVEVHGISRLARDHRIERGDDAVVVVLVVERDAAIEEGGGEVRIELDRLVDVLRGAIELAPVVIGDAAIVEC
jgi:hypothetical protein